MDGAVAGYHRRRHPCGGLVRVGDELHGGRLVPGPRLRTSDGVASRGNTWTRVNAPSVGGMNATFTGIVCTAVNVCIGGRAHLDEHGSGTVRTALERHGLDVAVDAGLAQQRALWHQLRERVELPCGRLQLERARGRPLERQHVDCGHASIRARRKPLWHQLRQRVELRRRGNVGDVGAARAALERLDVVIDGVTDCRCSQCDRLPRGELLSRRRCLQRSVRQHPTGGRAIRRCHVECSDDGAGVRRRRHPAVRRHVPQPELLRRGRELRRSGCSRRYNAGRALEREHLDGGAGSQRRWESRNRARRRVLQQRHRLLRLRRIDGNEHDDSDPRALERFRVVARERAAACRRRWSLPRNRVRECDGVLLGR